MTNEPVRLKGIAASPGYAIAKAYVLNQETYTPEREHIQHAESEQERFRQAVSAARSDLEKIHASTLAKLGPGEAEIFEGHMLLLEDPEFTDAILDQIGEQHVNAEYALHEVTRMFIDIFAGMDNELLRARATDLADVSGRVMNHLRGGSHTDLSALQEPCVIVAKDLTPSETASMNFDYVQGIVTEIGSRTSHTAIMARSLEIPAIVGAGERLMSIPQGTMLILDAEQGEIVIDPAEAVIAQYEQKKKDDEERKIAYQKLKEMPTQTKDGRRIELAANIGSLEDVQKAVEHGAEGIGLFRTEFLYMERTRLPNEEEQFQVYKHVLEMMEGKPVVIRTLDIGGDKHLTYMTLPKENNPFLGLRAIRLCLSQEDIFRTQLRALLRASVHGNLKIMFPMIAVMDEWKKAKQLLDEERQKLLTEGIAVSDKLEVGMMIEVPAAALIADHFAKEVDFFSIGTNDLIQYTMAADRMNEEVSYLYQPLHPSIIRLIEMVVRAAEQEGIWVGMCGEMAGDAQAIPTLVGLGLHELSMSASSILPARAMIAELTYSQIAAGEGGL